MHILHVTPYYAPAYAFGGVVRAVEGMANALARRGHRITVLTTDALGPSTRYVGAPDETAGGVRVVRVRNISPFLRGRFNLSTPNTMRRAARELLPDVDVVHCHEFRTVENLLVTPVAHELSRPLILSPHGTLALETGRTRLKSAWDRLLSPASARRFDHVIGLTAHEVEMARVFWQRFGRWRAPLAFSVIPNGIDPGDYANLTGGAAFRAAYGLGDGAVCLFVGRLHERKGVELLARAFRAADVPGARLVIVGPDEGMRPRLEALLDARIVLTGYLSGAARLAAFAAADVLALPAVGEGLPMAVLEAMGAGLPVIVSPGCHLPEVAEYDAGIETAPAVEPLRAALVTLLSDAGKRSTMGENARRLIQACFTLDAVAAQLERLYAGTV